VAYRPKWRIALEQWLRLRENGVIFDWLTFDEGYGSKTPFLWILGRMGQKFVAEVLVSFSVRRSARGRSCRAEELQPARGTGGWKRFRITRKTQASAVWRAQAVRVWAARGWHWLVTAIHESTDEVKYFVTNAVDEPLTRILRVAFRRATVEQAFRRAKQEAGLMHYEGRQYVGLMRHLIMALVVLGFVAEQTERLRRKKPGGDGGAGVPGVEPAVPGDVGSPSRGPGATPPGPGDSLSSATQRPSHSVSEETAA
jgi:SRSO17 transposase